MTWALGGLKPWAKAAAVEIGHRFGISDIGGLGSRSNPTDHDDGLATDFMTTHGQPLADYARANARRLGVTYVIWHQRIWSVARSSEGWRLMEDRGSPTANHMDHVHVSYTATAPAGFHGGAGGAQGGSVGGSSAPSTGQTAQNGSHTTISASSKPAGLLGGLFGIGDAAEQGIVLAAVLSVGVGLIVVGLARATKPLTGPALDLGLTVAAPEFKAATALTATAAKGAAR